MKRILSPRIMLIASMVIFGTLAPFVRNIPVSSAELALYRAVIAMLVISLYMLATRQSIPLAKIKRSIPLLLISGAAMGINWILLFEAYKCTTVSIATLSYYFAPVIVLLISPILFKEKITKKQLLCFSMSTLGLVFITGIGHSNGHNHLIGILLGVSAAVFYAAVILINKFIRGVDGIQRTLLQFFSASIVFFPYVLFTSGITIGTLTCIGWVNLLIVGILHTGITYCMYFSSVKELSGQSTAILSYIDPLVAVMISVLVLGEVISMQQAVGGMLILGFTLWNEVSSGSK